MHIQLTETSGTFTFTPHTVRIHPNRITKDMRATHQYIRIILDDTIPLDEIHFFDDTHRMIMKGTAKQP